MKPSETRKKCPYVERDISWMYFNQRILLEAARPEVPLLERLTFLGIYSNNLDEFFRVRVATLNRIIEYDDKNIQKEQEIAAHTLKQIGKLHNRYYEQFEETFASIMEELKKENIYVIKETEMNDEQKAFITSFYRNKLNGSTNPLFLNGPRQLDDQTDEDIYLAIRLLRKDEAGKIKEKDYAVIQLPVGEFGRFIQLPESEGKTYLMFLDDVIRYCLPMIFVGMKYTDYEAYTFKFTKDAEMEIDSDLRTGVLQKISKGVKSIKMTLYRLAKDSKVVKALICAAKNGKKVTVVIELLARFDEASNINWSKRMQDAGIRVIFGVEGLKIHSKLVHIGTRHGDIVCISTGNFHEGNARMYTDYTIMTAHRPIVREVNAVFDFIEKPYTPVNFKELLVSPNDMRKRLIALINKEIKNKEQGKDAYILAKVNHITDRALIEKLYEASAAGVKIELVVRGNCSLVPGVPGVSENIHINGIIDRYLEHSRIFIFANAGEERYYIGSADWMPRNLDNRIEVLAPVYDKEIQADLKRIVCYGFQDTAKGRIVDGMGTNRIWNFPFTPPLSEEMASLFRSQEKLYNECKNT